MIGNGERFLAGRRTARETTVSAPALRQRDSTDKNGISGVDVTAWWRRHLARRVPDLYNKRPGEFLCFLFAYAPSKPHTDTLNLDDP